jgi:hypothetical protein
VPTAGVGGDAGADEAEDGGERDELGIGAGLGGGAGGRGRDDVVDEQQCPGFLAGQFRDWPRSGRRVPRTFFFRWRNAVSVSHR